ncbi:MAG: PorT family protein [Crocinitomicaceae bacterium]|nr:PorT family protein [Crocinitomicaceae bacterium]
METPEKNKVPGRIPAHYLDDINQRLDALEKKRKRRRLLWFLFPGVVIAGIGLGLYAYHDAPVRVSKKSTNDTPEKRQAHNAPIAPKHKAFATQDPEVQTPSTVQTNTQAFVTQSKQEMRSKHDQGFSHFKADKRQQSALITELPKQTFAAQEQEIITELLPSTEAKEINNATVPLLTIGQIGLLPWPPVGTLKTSKSEAKKQHLFGFSSGVSGIISSFTPIEVSAQTFANTSFPDYKSYAQARKAAERATSSLDMALFYRLQDSHWLYQIGLSYNEWGEQIVYPFNSLDGTNRYRYLNLPVMVGYQWTKNKVSISPMLGLSAGVKLSGRGYYLTSNGNVDIVEAQRFATSGLAQIEVAYHLDPLIFHVTPGFRSSLGSPVKSGLTKNHYQALGCQIGIIFRVEGKTN